VVGTGSLGVGAWEAHIDWITASDTCWFAVFEDLFHPVFVGLCTPAPLGGVPGLFHVLIFVAIRWSAGWGYPLALAVSLFIMRVSRFSRQYMHGHVPTVLSIHPL
jgi:hypothetical protein